MAKVRAFGQMSIRGKLILLVGCVFVLIAAILSFLYCYYQKIEKATMFQDRVHRVLEQVLTATVAEKTYLQYHRPEHMDHFRAICGGVQSNVASIAQGSLDGNAAEGVAALAVEITKYSSLFEELVEVNRRKSVAQSRMLNESKNAVTAIEKIQSVIEKKQLDLQIEGGAIAPMETSLLMTARDCRNFLFRLDNCRQEYVIAGDTNLVQVFVKLATGPDRLMVDAFEKSAKLVADYDKVNFLEQAQSFKTNLAAFVASVGEMNGLLSAEKEKTVFTDNSGSRIEKIIEPILIEATESADRASRTAMKIVSMITVVGSVIFVLIGVTIIRSVMRTISSASSVFGEISKGDLTRRLDVGKDEIGQMSEGINGFLQKLQAMIGETDGIVSMLASSSEELSATSTQMASNAEEMSAQSRVVAVAGGQLSGNIETMASSATKISTSTLTVTASIEEMSSSINEVARSCSKESSIAQQANEQAIQTREIMARLGESASEIGKVVDVISGIADQTNLLALNATIEAASAGDAGKGFAVVASEVKELARQSAHATDQIADQIKQIQDNTKSAVTAINEIARIVSEVSSISGTIAAAVEEQSATTGEIARTVSGVSVATNEMARNVQESARAASEVSRNIQDVSESSSQVAAGATQTNASAHELAKVATRLKGIVGQFKL